MPLTVESIRHFRQTPVTEWHSGHPRVLPLPGDWDVAEAVWIGADRAAVFRYDLKRSRFLASLWRISEGQWGLEKPESEDLPTLLQSNPFVVTPVASGDGVLRTQETEGASTLLLPGGGRLSASGVGVSDPAPFASGFFYAAPSNALLRIFRHRPGETVDAMVVPPFRHGHAYSPWVWGAGGFLFHESVQFADPAHRDLGFAYRLNVYPLSNDGHWEPALRAFPVGASEKNDLLPFKVSGSADGAVFAFTGSWSAERNLVWWQEAKPLRSPALSGESGHAWLRFPFAASVHSLDFHPAEPRRLLVTAAPLDVTKNRVFDLEVKQKQKRPWHIPLGRLLADVLGALAAVFCAFQGIRHARRG